MNILINANAKYNIIPAGRRAGKTSGAVIASIIETSKDKKTLWVDTIYSNIEKYIERYFTPILKDIQIKYDWNSQKKY